MCVEDEVYRDVTVGIALVIEQTSAEELAVGEADRVPTSTHLDVTEYDNEMVERG